MSSREQILAAVKNNRPKDVPHPGLQGNWITYEDRAAQFRSVLEMVGGYVIGVNAAADVDQVINELDVVKDAKQVCSLIPDVQAGNVDIDAIKDPHELEPVDIAIISGEFGVAENGAVWVKGEHLKHRAILFIAQHVVLVLDRSEIVNNLHEAYQRISFTQPGFGVFVCGPSKTADIEQSLVIGAHGARSMTLLLIEN